MSTRTGESAKYVVSVQQTEQRQAVLKRLKHRFEKNLNRIICQSKERRLSKKQKNQYAKKPVFKKIGFLSVSMDKSSRNQFEKSVLIVKMIWKIAKRIESRKKIGGSREKTYFESSLIDTCGGLNDQNVLKKQKKESLSKTAKGWQSCCRARGTGIDTAYTFPMRLFDPEWYGRDLGLIHTLEINHFG